MDTSAHAKPRRTLTPPSPVFLRDRAAENSGPRVVRQEDSDLPTDTTSFHTRGFPVLSAFTGIQGGDLIIEVDGTTIENLYDYTWALEVLQPGVPARLIVLRDDERIALEIVPSSRD